MHVTALTAGLQTGVRAYRFICWTGQLNVWLTARGVQDPHHCTLKTARKTFEGLRLHCSFWLFLSRPIQADDAAQLLPVISLGSVSNPSSSVCIGCVYQCAFQNFFFVLGVPPPKKSL